MDKSLCANGYTQYVGIVAPGTLTGDGIEGPASMYARMFSMMVVAFCTPFRTTISAMTNALTNIMAQMRSLGEGAINVTSQG